MVGIDETAERLDRVMGARLRRARKARGLTQTALGEALGVTFQQVQKYESGANRISSSAMVVICKTLEVSPLELMAMTDAASSDIDWDLLSVEGSEQLLLHYRRIGSAVHRRAVIDFAKALSKTAPEDEAG